jgi:glutamine synthetase
MGTYLEFRVPSASSVGYITIAGLVAAGLDGVKRKMPLPPPVTSHGP